MPERDSFFGIWDMYAGPTHTELMLHPDGNYCHAMWGGVQSHWGAWSLQQQDGHTVLVMELRGAQPMVFNGPFGPTPMQWPATEQYAILSVQPNQVNFYDSLMVRRSIQQQGAQQAAATPWMQAGPAPAPMAQPPPAPAMAQPPPAPQAQPPPPAAGYAPFPPRVDFSVLAAYSAPPPPPPPDPHNADVLKQWQGLTLQTLMAQGQTDIDIFNAQQELSTMQMDAQLTATRDMQKMFHKQNDKFIDMLRG